MVARLVRELCRLLSGLLRGFACVAVQEQEIFLRVLGFTGLEVNRGMLHRGLRPGGTASHYSGSVGLSRGVRLRSRGVVSPPRIKGLARVFGDFLVEVLRLSLRGWLTIFSSLELALIGNAEVLPPGWVSVERSSRRVRKVAGSSKSL